MAPRLFCREFHWVEPKLVAEITYLTWTADNLLRHTVYVGLREDKPAEPKLVAEITYLTWTADNLLRHTVYVGLREDKPAGQVRREPGLVQRET